MSRLWEIVHAPPAESALSRFTLCQSPSQKTGKTAKDQRRKGEMNTMENTQEKSSQVRGDGCVYVRGTTYWVAFYRNGKLIRESAKTSDHDKALNHLRKCTKAAAKAEGAGLDYMTSKSRKRTISELVAALRTHFEIEGKASPQALSNFRRVDQDFGSY